MKFAHRYILRKSIPGYNVGREVTWHGTNQRFYFRKVDERDTELVRYAYDFEGPKFTVEQVQDESWFVPNSEIVDFIPAFPSRNDLEEYIFLTPECRLVDDVDICRAINTMLGSEKFQQALYEFYKQQYNAFHGLEQHPTMPSMRPR